MRTTLWHLTSLKFYQEKPISDIHNSKIKAFGLNQDMVIVKTDGSEIN